MKFPEYEDPELQRFIKDQKYYDKQINIRLVLLALFLGFIAFAWVISL